MIKFFLQRPISVLMVFLACVIIGAITYSTLPVSLLPDIPIPEITVQLNESNTSARELESAVVKPIRQQLMQVNNLQSIRSEARDSRAIINLRFNYGTNTDLAFIEVNEKIDAAMNALPRDFSRPQVIKASASDIPLFYLNLTLKKDRAYTDTNEHEFIELSDFSKNIVKRRIEQLPEVAMADMTGLMYKYLKIIPNIGILEAASISLSDIEKALLDNNIELGSMVVRDGYYEYSINLSSILRTPEDVRNIYLEKDGRMLQLKDLAKIEVACQPETGMSLINGKRAVTIGIIKQPEETIAHLKKSLNATLADLKKSYPKVEFTINRNQTELLDYTILNLKQSLFLGFILVFVIALIFLGNAKATLVIGISMVSALVVSFIFFYLFNQSINVISLSGLILALGMMIDSAIIVTDIISQHRENGYQLEDACLKGTNEVITPILSSTLTTIAVFLPLIFMSGIAGAIFSSQAFAISVGLIVSYCTGIVLLPVLYNLIYSIPFKKNGVSHFFDSMQKKAQNWSLFWYDKGLRFVFRHKIASFLFLMLSVPFCVLMFFIVPKSAMPHLDYTETIATIEWNENIHVGENKNRTLKLLRLADVYAIEHASYVGHKQYLLGKENDLLSSQTQLYFRTDNNSKVDKLQRFISEYITANYTHAVVTFSPPENIFEKIFDTKEAELEAQLYPSNSEEVPGTEAVHDIERQLHTATGVKSENVPFEQQITITIDREKLLLYGVDYQEMLRILKTAFNNNPIADLHSFQQYLPISLVGKPQTVEQVLRETLVRATPTSTSEDITPVASQQKISPTRPAKTETIPLQTLVSVTQTEQVKTIIAGKTGEYIPLRYHKVKHPEALVKKIQDVIRNIGSWQVTFSGSIFSNQKMMSELIIILLVSILLIYFILSSQFESFLQPLIVIAEVPIDVGFALALLFFTGNTLNLMSAIGLIVSVGVIINDSILKLDMINALRKQGLPLMEAIHTAGNKRLRSIIMTTLTTIFAMVPMLFFFDLGSALQKPLAIAMMGTMLVGMLVSLFMIPLVYWAIYRRKKETNYNY